MRATQEQIMQALNAVGAADVEVVENSEDSDFSLDDFLSIIDSNRESILKPRLTEQLTQQIQTEIAGKAGYGLRKALRELTGMDKKQLEAIANDREAIQAAMDFKLGASTTAQQDVQRRIDEMMTQHEEELNSRNSEWEGKYNALNDKYVDRDILSHYRSKLKDAPLPNTADRDVLSADFKSYMQTKYAHTYDEDKQTVGLFMKDNPTMPALNGNKHLDILDEAKDYFTKRGLWVTDTRNEKPTQPNTPTMSSLDNPVNKMLGMDNGYNPAALVEQINAAATARQNPVA